MKIIFVKTGENRIPRAGDWVYTGGTAYFTCRDEQYDRYHDIVAPLKVEDDAPGKAGGLAEILSGDLNIVQNLEYSLILP